MRSVQGYYKEISEICEYGVEWELLKNKSILILGATGKIGKVLVDVFANRNIIYNSSIKICVNSRSKQSIIREFGNYINYEWFSFWVSDLCDEVLSIPEDIDYVILGAGNAHPALYTEKPVETLMANINSVDKFCKYSKRKKTRLLLLSSIAVYGDKPSDIYRFKENDYGYFDSSEMKNSYAEAKRSAEAIGVGYSQQYGVDFLAVRLAKVYGPIISKDDTNARNQIIIEACCNNKITLISKGEQRSSYIYVTDAIKGIIFVLLKGERGNIYNIANEENEASLMEFASKIARCYNGVKIEFNISQNSMYSNVKETFLDTTKIETMGWIPEVKLDDGISRTCNIINQMKKNGMYE